MGAQKNRLNETVLQNTQNMLKLIGKKIFYAQNFVYLNLRTYLDDSVIYILKEADEILDSHIDFGQMDLVSITLALLLTHSLLIMTFLENLPKIELYSNHGERDVSSWVEPVLS